LTFLSAGGTSNSLDLKQNFYSEKKDGILKGRNMIFSFSKGGEGKVSGIFVVRNEKGLHTRPSTELVKCAASFEARITLYYRHHVVNGKSLLGILMLAAERGSKIRIEAVGKDAQRAVVTLLRLAENKFNIKY
jgi:phosphocarrier protein HPr